MGGLLLLGVIISIVAARLRSNDQVVGTVTVDGQLVTAGSIVMNLQGKSHRYTFAQNKPGHFEFNGLKISPPMTAQINVTAQEPIGFSKSRLEVQLGKPLQLKFKTRRPDPLSLKEDVAEPLARAQSNDELERFKRIIGVGKTHYLKFELSEDSLHRNIILKYPIVEQGIVYRVEILLQSHRDDFVNLRRNRTLTVEGKLQNIRMMGTPNQLRVEFTNCTLLSQDD